MKPENHICEPSSPRRLEGSFIPITLEEVRRRGWEQVDVVFVSGDAYVDHPSFGTAVLARTLEAAGYRVAIIPQPNWRDDLRDFKKFGAPRLCFAVTAGVMDSMVNHYTAARRLRHDDAYTPGGQAGFRPDYASYVYTSVLKRLYPQVPVLVGGIEASMRRLSHYDYWSDRLKPSFLAEAPADLLLYGMGERVLQQVVDGLAHGQPVEALRTLPQVAYMADDLRQVDGEPLMLHSFEDCCRSKRAQAENFHHIEQESNKIVCSTLVQPHGSRYVVVNPPGAPFTQEELDRSFDLPYTRLPHPKYKKRGAVPAYEMIKHSINTHRGCFGGCAFCTISAHQGKQIVSRSEASILNEVRKVTRMDDFHGTITDVGGPSANMYRMSGRDKTLCAKCARYSCMHPSLCKNLDSDHRHLVSLYRKVASQPGVRHVFIGSGIRCDLFTADNGGFDYFKEVVLHHVSGRLKVAPEHTSDAVLKLMRKPSFDVFRRTKQDFDRLCQQHGLRYQLIPYFISSHPGCRLSDMAALAVEMRRMGYRLEQIQDFTPTPMTLSTEMYYTGFNPDTMEPVYVATHPNEKREQNLLFFYYKKECRAAIRQALLKSHNGQFLKPLGL
ncbi:MAG: YgiQ family radical SAM protein [Bacteroidales bacterium]|nr:YgiQ family radical SAM protein [Bacteroidales bacterium]